jgi:hypothetical protein
LRFKPLSALTAAGTPAGTATEVVDRPGIINVLRHELRSQRAARAARKQLSRDLATYTRPSEIEELEAVLERYDEAETADIRRILVINRNRAA